MKDLEEQVKAVSIEMLDEKKRSKKGEVWKWQKQLKVGGGGKMKGKQRKKQQMRKSRLEV